MLNQLLIICASLVCLSTQQSFSCTTNSYCPSWENCATEFSTQLESAVAGGNVPDNCPIVSSYLTCLENACDGDSFCISGFATACLEESPFFEISYHCSLDCANSGSIISPGCLNPSGANCSFYADCLEQNVPCGTSGYALAYGAYFCSLYSQNYNQFSSTGQAWINAVRTCLQVALVPYLSEKPSCDALKTNAFNSHVACYTDPEPGLSVCSLSISDWVAIVNTIKSAIVTDTSATLIQTVESISTCGGIYFSQLKVLVSSTSSTIVQDLQNEVSTILTEVDTIVYDLGSLLKRSATDSTIRIVVFGSSAHPASTAAATLANATIHGQLNITGVTMSVCSGSCDTYVSSPGSPSEGARFTALFSVMIFSLSFMFLKFFRE